MAIAIVLGGVGCSGSETAPRAAVTAVIAPGQVVAGSAIEVVVEGEGSGSVELDVVDAYAVTTYVAAMSDGSATVELPPELTSTSGVIEFIARGATNDGVVATSTATTQVVPDSAAASIDVHAGPRTIIADGNDTTMVATIPSDAFGNPLPDGHAVIITLVDDAGRVVDVDADIEHGVAAELISSGTSAGTVEVFATDGSVSSRRVEYDEVPGAASAVSTVLTGDSSTLVADGRQLIEVSTSTIVDRFGNRLLDGHLVQLRTDGPGGVGLATATTIDGIARFRVPAPSRPGTVTLAAMVDGTVGEPMILTFAPAVSAIPAVVRIDDTGSSIVDVGPVLDALGAVVSDGTPVTVSTDGAESIDLPLRGGMASIDVGVLDVGTAVDIEVLGVMRTVTA
jgi:hypothetical protein